LNASAGFSDAAVDFRPTLNGEQRRELLYEGLVNYAAFVKDKSLKGEFIRTVMGRADLPEEDKATVIHYGLQALAGEEILDA
jgi:hypothetical protein